MLPTAHLAVTYIVWWIANHYFGADLNSLILGIILGVLIDGDALLLGSKHRASPLHSYLLWVLLIPTLYILNIKYFWTPIFALIHLVLDTIDYEVYIAYPISNKSLGLNLAAKNSSLIPGKNSLAEFAMHYLHIKPLIALELIFGVSAIILLVI